MRGGDCAPNRSVMRMRYFVDIAGPLSLRQRGRQQNVRDLARTLDMAIVASLQFGDLPAGSTGFPGKRLEERPRRISFRNAGNESGWNAGLRLAGRRSGSSKQRRLKSHSLARTKSRASPGFSPQRSSWPSPPGNRQPSPCSRADVAKMGANLRRKQVQDTLPIFRNERIQENQVGVFELGSSLPHR